MEDWKETGGKYESCMAGMAMDISSGDLLSGLAGGVSQSGCELRNWSS